MFTSEIKETIYLAINLILVAAVLGLVAFMMGLRSDYATVYNNEISTRNEISAYSKFDNYQGEVIYGEDIIAIIREYASSDIAVCIQNLQFKSDGGVNVSEPLYFVNKRLYLENPDKYSVKTLEFGLDTDASTHKGISRNATYFSYLVFGKYTEDEIKSAKYVDMDNLGSGDSLEYINYGDVTGIKIVCVDSSKRCNVLEVESTIANIMKS